MERLTEKNWKNLDPWECCGQDRFCGRRSDDLGGCRNGCIVPKLYARLAAYEDTDMTPEQIQQTQEYMKPFTIQDMDRFREIMTAEKDGRLVVLPCKNGTVYTIQEDYFNCDECKHKNSAHYQKNIGKVSCDMRNGERCPLYIKEQEAEGFEITFDKTGVSHLSHPGEFGCEGLEAFCGIDGKVYYTREEAEAALKKREGADNEAD